VTATVLIGLLGCGPSAERIHLPAIRALRGARLTAAYDPSPERREALARLAPGCRPVASAEALFETRAVDAVIIAAPLAKRATLAVQSLGEGVPVLIEPPMAASIEEGAWIMEAEQAVRLPVMVGYNRRWWRPVQLVHRALASGPSEPDAETTSVESTILRRREPGTGADETAADLPLLADLNLHLDLVRHLLDREIATVTARRDPLDQVQVEASFHAGGSARCWVGRGERAEERLTIRVGKRVFELRAGSGRARPSGGTARAAIDLAAATGRRLTAVQDSLAQSYEQQLSGFLDAVRARARTVPGTADGLAALLAVEAARRSLAAGAVETEVPLTPTG
jgi:myo-inositol 2-dehydrogenase/D-chiro-inositol 1-dehydrogenase